MEVNYCRTCHSSQEDLLVDIFQQNYTKLYMEFTNLSISREDLYSKFICLLCIEELHHFNDFKKKCMNALDKYYNDVISMSNDIKREPDENPLDDSDSGDIFLNSFVEVKSEPSPDENFETRRQNVMKKEKEVEDYLEEHEISESDKKFECYQDDCSKTYHSLDRFKAHLRTHFGLKPEVCFICYKQFSGYRNKKRHMSTHDTNSNHKCPHEHCDYSYNCDRNLREHMKRNHSKDPRLPCTICDKTFPTTGTLKAHINTHSDVRNHICCTCNKTFKTAGELKTHEISHSDSKPYNCSSCDRTFKSSMSLKVHQAKHQVKKVYKCDSCEKKFCKMNNLLEHKEAHKNPFICDLCSRPFTSLRSLESHLMNHDKSKNPLKRKLCDICGNDFCSWRSLKRHKETHNTTKDYKCHFEDCKYATKTKRNLETHIRRMHSNLPRQPCPHCGKLYLAESLQTHIKTHSEERNYVCKTCLKAFKTAGELNVHSTTHSNFRPFNCSLCGMGFKTKSILNSHSKIHQEDRKTYNCNLCSKTYVSCDGLKNHKIMVHSTERPYECDYCTLRFAYKTALTMHLKVHSDKRDRICNICQASFKHKASLYNHMKGHRKNMNLNNL